MSVFSSSTRSRRLLTATIGTLFAASLLPAVGVAQAQENTTQQAPTEQQGTQPETICSPYGLDSDDPRANPPTFGAESAEGVDLNIPHESAAGTQGTYHLFTRDVDFSEPVGVVVRLHGDGAMEYHYPETLLNCQAAVAAAHNMILVAPHSPSTSEDGTARWWYEVPKNVEWVTDLLYTDILPIENVDPDNIWWVGYSGGAEMITHGLIPLAPEMVTGGAVILGGGGIPDDLEEEGVRTDLLNDVPLHWIVGAEDDGTDEAAPWDAVEKAQQGATGYREQGLDTTLTVLEGVDHFDLPHAALLEAALVGETASPEDADAETAAAAEATTVDAAVQEAQPAPEVEPAPEPLPLTPENVIGAVTAGNGPTTFAPPAEIENLLGVPLPDVTIP